MRLNRLLVLALIIVASLSLMLVAARPLQPTDPTDLADVALWLAAGPGAVFIALYVVSHVLEWVPAWGAKLSGLHRGIIVTVLSLLIALAAFFLLRAPPIIDAVQPYYRVIVLVLLALAGSQAGFLQQKAAGDLSRPKIE